MKEKRGERREKRILLVGGGGIDIDVIERERGNER